MFTSVSSRISTARAAIVVSMLLLAVPLGTATADARAGGGFSFGSRGARSFSMPSTTNTAPRPAQPFGQTEAVRPQPYGSTAFAPQRRFGFGSGLAAGLLGAGLFGLLTGHGFFGGIGGLGSLFGLLVQIGLVVLLVRWALRAFRGQPVMAGGRSTLDGAAPIGMAAARPASTQITIGPQDYTAFERSLVAIQDAYGREDVAALSRLVTPEMMRHLGRDLEVNQRQGLHNAVSGARLLQGDLAEAWREGATDYATVAMRFSALDTMVDRASGRLVSGDAARPVEATEIWTFRRDGGTPWLLSGIQQTA